jgi:hypothetical protein
MTASKEERDDAYRAVGRYVVEFSRLIFHMRLAIEGRLRGSESEVVAARVLSKVGADAIRSNFFALCKESLELIGVEKEIAKRLDSQVRREIKRRNKFAHSDWWIGFGKIEDGSGGNPTLSGSGFLFLNEIPTAEIDGFTDTLHELRQQVAEFGDLCLGRWPLKPDLDPPARVGDVFTYKDGKIRRDGPLAQSIGGVIEYS